MLDYYRKNRLVSFGFVAASDLAENIDGKAIDLRKGNRRFRFYKRLLANLFGPQTFYQVADMTNTIYLMINNKQLKSGVISIESIEKKLNELYSGNFAISDIQ